MSDAPKLNLAEAVHAQNLTGTPDLSKIAVGTFAHLGGMPADALRARILDRAGVPQQLKAADGSTAVHPLRADLLHTHPATQAQNVPRLPDPFPPEGYPGPLASAQEWLDLIDAAMAPIAEKAGEKTDGEPAKTAGTAAEQPPTEQVAATDEASAEKAPA